MKLTLEKEEIQLLGQLVLEIELRNYNPALFVNAILLWEFKIENAGVFAQPERIKRKIKLSTLIGLRTYLKMQHPRGDTWWDMTLVGLKDKLERIAQASPKPEDQQLMLK